MADMHLVQATGRETSPEFSALNLLVKSHGYHVDQLERAGALQARLHQFVFVPSNDAIRDRALDEFQPLFDLVWICRRTVLAEQILKHIHRDAETGLQSFNKVLAHNTTGEGRRKLSVEVVKHQIVTHSSTPIVQLQCQPYNDSDRKSTRL